MFRLAIPAIAALFTSMSAPAAINGFTESFTVGSANWRNAGQTALGWSAAGGPQNQAYVTGLLNLAPLSSGGFPATVIRAAESYGSSNGGYVGNWITSGVTNVQFWFRHDLPQPITVTGRFATPNNSPGASVASGSPIAANSWTLVNFSILENSIISTGGGTYQGIFSNIGNIQIGFQLPASLAGQNITGSFDMTGFTLTPAPGALALLAAGGLARSRRR